jgi:hypothetical protein
MPTQYAYYTLYTKAKCSILVKEDILHTRYCYIFFKVTAAVLHTGYLKKWLTKRVLYGKITVQTHCLGIVCVLTKIRVLTYTAVLQLVGYKITMREEFLSFKSTKKVLNNKI